MIIVRIYSFTGALKTRVFFFKNCSNQTKVVNASISKEY